MAQLCIRIEAMDRDEPPGVTHLRDYMSPEKQDKIAQRRVVQEISALKDEMHSVSRKFDTFLQRSASALGGASTGGYATGAGVKIGLGDVAAVALMGVGLVAAFGALRR